jgi:hypothetical protein
MDLDAARSELTRALDAAASSADSNAIMREARAFLIECGVEAIGIDPATVRSLDDVVRCAAAAPRGAGRRDFAVLLVHALSVDGLLPPRGAPERHIQAYLEHALLNPLRRAAYPFDASVYEKRRFLAGLHRSIDEHLRPLEASFPRWIQGPPGEDEECS